MRQQLKAPSQRALDAQELFAHTSPDGSLWDGALCAGSVFPDLWFPNMGGNAMSDSEIISAGMALEICDSCPIREQCLEVGLRDEDVRHGIWGSMLAGERLALRAKLTRKTLSLVDREMIRGARMVRSRINKLNGVKV